MKAQGMMARLGYDLLLALSLMTRLPIFGALNSAQYSPAHSVRAAWAWPVAGAIVGCLAGAGAGLSLRIGLTPGLAAAIGLAILILSTGALHEDGLADSADGLFGGGQAARRLEIMKDSHIGSYGTLALIISFLIRWLALAGLIDAGGGFWYDILFLFMGVAVLSRVPMVLIMHLLPNARGAGLAHHLGAPPMGAVIVACALGVGVCLGVFGLWAGGVMIVAVGFVGLGVGLFARSRIGGQTGDILGAAQQLSEIAALLCAVALM